LLAIGVEVSRAAPCGILTRFLAAGVVQLTGQDIGRSSGREVAVGSTAYYAAAQIRSALAGINVIA